MPVRVRSTDDGIGMVGEGVGVVSGRDLLDATARLFGAFGRNPAIRYAIMDLSALSEQKIDTPSLEELARPLEKMPSLVVAVVAPSQVLYGLGRMWQILAEQPNLVTRIVRTRAEAVTWIAEELGRAVSPFDANGP